MCGVGVGVGVIRRKALNGIRKYVRAGDAQRCPFALIQVVRWKTNHAIAIVFICAFSAAPCGLGKLSVKLTVL